VPAIVGFSIPAMPKQNIMGGSNSSGVSSAGSGFFSLPDIEIVRGILGCAMASDRF
jgi:hypothetical protein